MIHDVELNRLLVVLLSEEITAFVEFSVKFEAFIIESFSDIRESIVVLMPLAIVVFIFFCIAIVSIGVFLISEIDAIVALIVSFLIFGIEAFLAMDNIEVEFISLVGILAAVELITDLTDSDILESEVVFDISLVNKEVTSSKIG